MLSNPVLENSGVYRLVPVERLVVDEASQIDSFEFMVSTILFFETIASLKSVVCRLSQHLFHMFKQLVKVCMFGDPKQCEF